MKIMMLIDSLVKGGRERRLLELLKSFSRRHDISVSLVIFSKKVEYEEVFDLPVPIYFLERNPRKDPRIFYRFYKICKELQPDIIHSWGTMPSIYAIPTVKLLGIKFLNANIADAPKNMNFLNKEYLRARMTFPFSDTIVGNSEAGLKAYRAPRKKSRCVYNGFDFQRISHLEDKEKVRQRFHILPGKVIGMVGAFFDRKDYATYIEAACIFLRQRQDATFLALGAGPNFQQFQSKVIGSFRKRILFPGLVHDIESLINVFDIGILCTNAQVHGEGISNAIMEYMALKKAVVASEGGGTNELVVNGETGFLVPPANPNALVEKLVYLLEHPHLAKRFGKCGKERIQNKFSLERMEKDYLEIYQNMHLFDLKAAL